MAAVAAGSAVAVRILVLPLGWDTRLIELALAIGIAGFVACSYWLTRLGYLSGVVVVFYSLAPALLADIA
ncbi:MAG: hypothetical protein JOY80_07435, partial [Candidatus Dormibacteraeota bacterium]|nr:hypothetical protein [Candidatus Dormibacteraeota bacterium]